MKKINLDIIKSKPIKIISSKESLKDIISIDWSKEVINGEKKVIVQ